MRMHKLILATVLCMVVLAACGGIRYSRISDEAKDFHPASIGILPVDEGAYIEATDVVDGIIVDELQKKAWFPTVVSTAVIKDQMVARADMRDIIADYLEKFDKLNFSDPDLSRKIGEFYGIDAFLVAGVDGWNYATESGDKVARVALTMTLVQAGTGTVMWRAGHHEAESYWFVKPELVDVARNVVEAMIDQMPHGNAGDQAPSPSDEKAKAETTE